MGRHKGSWRRALRIALAIGVLIGPSAASATLPLGGPVLIGGDDADDHGSTSAGTNYSGWFYIQRGFDLIGTNVGNGNTKAVCLGCNGPAYTGSSAPGGFQYGFDGSTLPGLGWTRVTLTTASDITDFFSGAGVVNVNNTGIIYLPTDENNVSGGISAAQIAIVDANASLLNTFVQNGGGLFTHDETYITGGFGWLTTLLPGIIRHDPSEQSCNDVSLAVTLDGVAALPGLTDPIASSATPWHSWFSGNFGGLDVLVTGPCSAGAQAVVLGGGQVVISQAINLTPKIGLNPVSTSHTVKAKVIDGGGQPVSGTTVSFLVLSGPNAGATGSQPTDSNGEALFTYPDTSGSGADVIQGCFVDAQQQTQCDTVLKFWDDDCNQNGVADSCDVSCAAFGDSPCGVFVNPPCGTSQDGNGNGIPDECQAGCIPADCNDNDPCTDDACDQQSSQCSHTPNTASCDDGNSCTTGDTCAAGSCQGAFVDCDDNNPCTDDLCDSSAPAFLCLHPLNGICIGPNCGNALIDTADGETCDPPNLAINPVSGQPFCRLDCTFCGDGKKNGGESCDDGNTVSGCDPVHPQKELDNCLNSCQSLICDDPAKIKLTRSPNELKFHGRLIVADGESIDLSSENFVIQLTRGGAVVFRASLVSGSITGTTSVAKYVDKTAKASSGIAKLKSLHKPGNYKVSLIAYGPLGEAAADMTTHVYVGAREFVVRGIWERIGSGWRLTGRSQLLAP
ncbi:MAG: hypothetical protein U0807_14235 [Candidatus Binatia bacterium]